MKKTHFPKLRFGPDDASGSNGEISTMMDAGADYFHGRTLVALMYWLP
jgi:hypothetical protein